MVESLDAKDVRSTYIPQSVCTFQVESDCGRKYVRFQSQLDFQSWYNDLISQLNLYRSIQQYPSVYEVIYQHEQKFKVDIDSELEVTPEYINSICSTINKMLPKCRLLVYSSNGLHPNGKPKWSYHIVESMYKFQNNEQCKMLASILKQSYSEVDLAVYNKTQLFRIELSSKLNHYRPKILCNIIDYGSRTSLCDTQHHNMLDGLISYTSNCVEPPDVTMELLEQKYNELQHVPKDLQASYYVCFESNGTLESKVGFVLSSVLQDSCSISSIDAQMIILRRNRSSYCLLCKRVHDSENPFIVIMPTECLRVYCRRSDGYVLVK